MGGGGSEVGFKMSRLCALAVPSEGRDLLYVCMYVCYLLLGCVAVWSLDLYPFATTGKV